LPAEGKTSKPRPPICCASHGLQRSTSSIERRWKSSSNSASAQASWPGMEVLKGARMRSMALMIGSAA
jgi:hypothetical protein